MKDTYKLIIIVLAICGIAFVAFSSFSLVQENQELLTYGDDFSNYSTSDSINLKDDVDVSDTLNITKGNYFLVIDCDAKWKIDYDVDGKSYQKEGNGTGKINLGTISNYAKINFNQLTEGSVNLEVYNSTDFVSSIYQSGKTVNLNYNLVVV